MKKFKFYIKKYTYKTNETTDVSFIPPMARRKLSQLDKTSICVLNECYENDNPKLIFASQYGELDRLKKLVAQYVEENEVSPATFSASVHNAAIGYFSLLNKIKESYNSISAEKNTFDAGLLEAILTAKQTDVLYCYCDSTESTEGFACIITTKEISGTKTLELEIHNNPIRQDESKWNLQNFLDFLENKNDIYISRNGLYKIQRSH